MQKRNMYLLILALAVCLLVLVLGITVAKQNSQEPLDYIQFRETIQGMELQPWFENGIWHLFLPAYAGEEDLSITAPLGVEFEINEVPGGQDMALRVSTPFRSREYGMQIHQCTNLPTLSLSAEEGTLEYIHSYLGYEKDVFVTMTDGEGSTLLEQVATISGRGNGTWTGNKRPYNLNFSSKVTLGEFKEISQFCLLAEAFDESKLRNSIAYYAGRELGIPYGSEYMHCNLYINGEYRGLYGVVTKQEYEKYIARDDIQGVFEYTSYHKENQFYSFPTLTPFRVFYGDMDRIRDVVDYAYDAILSQDWERCAQVLDIPSFAKKYVLDEFFSNDDMGYASQYYYLDGNNVIHCMLPWDYDWSMGSTNRSFDLPPVWDIQGYNWPEYWVRNLLESSQFREEVVKVVEQSLTQAWIDGIDEYTREQISMISDSLECDAVRWAGEMDINRYDKAPDGAHLLDLQEIYSRYYPERREFLAEYYRNRDAYCKVSFDEELNYPSFYVLKGTPMEEVLDKSWIWDRENLNRDVQLWRTESGLTPEEVGTVESDIVFLPVLNSQEEPVIEEPEQPQVPILNRPWLKLTALGGVAAVLVLLVGVEILRQRPGRKRKDEVAV